VCPPSDLIPNGTTGPGRTVHYVIFSGGRIMTRCRAPITHPLISTDDEVTCTSCVAAVSTELEKAISAADWDHPMLAGIDAVVVFYDIKPDGTAESYSDHLRPGFTPVLGAAITTVDVEGNRVTGTIIAVRMYRPERYEISIRLDLETFTSAGDPDTTRQPQG
jgi:hypothetical protein